MSIVINMSGGGGGDNKWKQWVTAGGLSTDNYESLEDVLKDEVAVRQLMTKHASADFLYEWYLSESDKPVTVLDAIMDSVYGAKWLGLRDYVCDKFMANATAQATMLASENWEYILKDHVPVMTSDTAPYGQASASSAYSGYNAFKAFTQNEAYGWASNSNVASWIQYKFTNPVCVKRFMFDRTRVGESDEPSLTISASNDGQTWVQLYSNSVSGKIIFSDNINNDNYYLYYRLSVRYAYNGSGIKLQFYGRSLDVSVPTMTSNTAPYGEVIFKGYQGSYYPYYAFDRNDSTVCTSTSSNVSSGAFIGYKFAHPVTIKRLHFVCTNGATQVGKVQASNDNVAWIDVSANINISPNVNTSVDLTTNAAYLYYRLYQVSASSNTDFSFKNVDFFGLDYSEREDRTYIYDHGVEVVPISEKMQSSNNLAVKEDSDLYYKNTGTQNAGGFYISNKKDLTDYILIRIITDDILVAASSRYGQLIVTPDEPRCGMTETKMTNINQSMIPNSIGLNISSVSGEYYIFYGETNAASIGTINEWWLE